MGHTIRGHHHTRLHWQSDHHCGAKARVTGHVRSHRLAHRSIGIFLVILILTNTKFVEDDSLALAKVISLFIVHHTLLQVHFRVRPGVLIAKKRELS